MRHRADANQGEVVKALRKIGCGVIPTSQMGAGFPDLVAFRNGSIFLMEVKNGKQKPSDRKLTPEQEKWHAQWKDYAIVVKSAEEAVNFVLRNPKTA